MLKAKKSDTCQHLILLLFTKIAVHYMFNIFEISKKTVKKAIVFKPSFKCFKNEKITLIQVILKLECLFTRI
jgi:hypothetical protein